MGLRGARGLVQLIRAAVVLVGVVTSGSAGAWIETSVSSHEVRVRVDERGLAEVRHDLVLRIRGSKIKALDVEGIGDPVEVLADATVRRAQQGSGASWPLVATPTEDGALRLAIQSERGVGGGSYRFDFSYRVDLRQRQLIESLGDDYALTFVGPRLSSGVDSAKVTFVLPRAARAPRLLESEDGPGAGVLLGQVRRAGSLDEIELVRAHVAKREPAVWRILVARDALPGVVLDGPARTTRRLVMAPRAIEPGLLRERGALALLLVSGLFGFLVVAKARLTARVASRARAVLRPIIPAGPVLRGALSSAGLACAGYLALSHRPLWALAPFVLVLLLVTFFLPVRPVAPRGPGVWEKLDRTRIGELPLSLSERSFELGSPVGFALFVLLVTATLLASFQILPQDNYLALMTLLLSVVILPLFWTGRAKDLPLTPFEQAASHLSFLSRAFDPGLLEVEAWGRRAQLDPGRAEGCFYYDEVRIRLVLRNPPRGLRTCEVALEEGAGSFVSPCVVLRVTEDSPALARLPRDIPWSRGRVEEERVAVLRPTAPTRAQLLRLLRSLVTSLRKPGDDPQVAASKKARRSKGRGEVTSKLAPSGPVPAI